ncbi:helix-turn-helix protein [anaerobic digester metagenome]|nr:helix-turn-helix transcriptional regulator [Lentimicrobiaceae bacterium]
MKKSKPLAASLERPRIQAKSSGHAVHIGTMLKEARKSKQMTQQELANIISKKRTYISRVENDGSNITLKTLYEIVEKGLGGKVDIHLKM